VVEIIKREHLERLKTRRSSLVGLHQYNEVCALQDLPSPPTSSPDATEMLSGSKFVAFFASPRVLLTVRSVKIKKTVFMKVTLSSKELKHLIGRGAT
jgi:hypothetical protein